MRSYRFPFFSGPVSLLLAASSIGFSGLTPFMSAFGQSGTPAPMQALPTHDPRLQQVNEAIHASKSPTWTALSPNAHTVAWTLRRKEGTQIHLTDIASSQDKVLTVGTGEGCSSESPVWSPDGVSVAFLSDCTGKPDQEQVFVWSMTTGTAKQVTKLKGEMTSLAWSPNGKSIGFLFVENATRSAGALGRDEALERSHR